MYCDAIKPDTFNMYILNLTLAGEVFDAGEVVGDD
jgi:hypothetical protein